MTRRQFMVRAAAAGLSVGAAAALLEACGGSSTSPSASPSALDTTKPENLYLSTGRTRSRPRTRPNFEQETGVKIVETYYDDNEMLIAKLKESAKGYDLIVPCRPRPARAKGDVWRAASSRDDVGAAAARWHESWQQVKSA